MMRGDFQGQSLSTIDKERQLAAALDMNMRIVALKCPGAIYKHIDLNAGCGWNHDFDVAGTPTVFHELAEQRLKKWEAYFFERDPDYAYQLVQRFNGIPNCHVIHADNRDFLGFAQRYLGRWDVGSVLADPNGYLYRNANGDGAPVQEMVRFFVEHSRMDLIANMNLRTFKLQRGANAHGLATYRPEFYTLRQFREVFGKKHGLISSMSNHGGDTFVRMILRNLRTNDYRAMGWYHLDSPEAQEIYHYTETTKAQRRTMRRKRQMELYDNSKHIPESA